MVEDKQIKESVEFLRKKISPMSSLISMLDSDSILDVKDLNSEQQKIINSMIQENLLIDIGRGIVTDSDWSPNDFLLRQLVLKQGIYSGNTALYLWELSDQFPYTVDMTFKTGYKLPASLSKWTNNVNVRQVSKSKVDLFVTELAVSGTNKKIKIYTPERCLIESIQSSAAILDVNTAIKNYLSMPSGNANKLLMVAKKLGNYKKIRQILEILL